MTYYCPQCVTNWYPFMCRDGACPECGTGTKRQTRSFVTADALERFEVVKARRASQFAHERFEAYYAERELARSGIADLPEAKR